MRNFLSRLFSAPSPLEEGRRLLSQGRHLEAEYLLKAQVKNGTTNRAVLELYAQVLSSQQRYVEALALTRSLAASGEVEPSVHVLLGTCLEAADDPEGAILSYQQALEKRPGHSEATTRLCRLLSSRGETEQALQIADEALLHEPQEADLIFCRGNVRFALGDATGARRDFEAVLQAQPFHRYAMSNLAMIAAEQREMEEAEQWLRKALEQSPEDFDFRLRLAHHLRLRERMDEAQAILMELRQDHPHSVEVHRMLGELHAARQQLSEAAVAFARAALLDTTNPAAYLQLGKIFFEVGNYDEAVKALQKSLTIKKSAEAYRMSGVALVRSFRVEEAIEQLELADELRPEDPETLTLLSVARGIRQGGTSAARDEYRNILRVNPSAHFVHSNLLFDLSFDASCSPQDYLSEARKFGEQIQKDLAQFILPDGFVRAAGTNTRIRLGMVSGDMHMHPVGFFLDALLSHIDRGRFSVYLYSNSFKEDALSVRLKSFAETWRNVRFLDDQEAARQIASDEVDVLFDLGGHTGKNRLGIFAIRAAPIQVSWLGYWASTGLDTMDYILADPHCLPAEDEPHFVERVIRMPNARLCFGNSLANAPLPSFSPWSVNGYLTFGCAQSLHKIGPELLEAWSSILARLPTARLRMRNMQFLDAKVRQASLERIAASGLPVERVDLLPALSREGYLEAYSEIDVCLDTFPFPGGTTTCDAMWMGVPTITKRGRNMIGRQGEALMTAAGLTDWVADDTQAYIEKACSVGADPRGLPELRRGLRARVKASPLFDGPRFARDFGALIEALVRKHSTEV